MANGARDDVVRLLPFRKGHFRFESGHHGDAWLDLELLCLNPAPIRSLAAELAARLDQHRIEVVCGPLVEGAFVALMVATELDLPFVYSERLAKNPSVGLFPFTYSLPGRLRQRVAGRRVAIVNDVINAGSAVRGTLSDLRDCGARTVVIASLAVLGDSASQLAAANELPLETIVALTTNLWMPSECPLCATGIPFSEGPSPESAAMAPCRSTPR